MNRLILAAAQKGERSGTPLTPTPMAEAMTDALNKLDRAQASGDPTEMAYHESVVDQLVADARAARSDPSRDPATSQFVPISFDGGVQSGRRLNAASVVPRTRQESANQLLMRAMGRSREQQQERTQEHTIHMR